MSRDEREWSGAMSDGAEWRVVEPSGWNGCLVLEPDLWEREGDRRLYAWLARRGFAYARLSRQAHAWDFPRTMNHLHRLHQTVRRSVGTPQRTIMWGRSLGSFVTRLAVESGILPAAGAIAVDGGGMGARGPMEAGADARFVLTALAAADDAERSALDASPEDARALLESWKGHPGGRARLTLAAAMRGTPFSSGDGQGSPDEQSDDIIEGVLADLAMGLESRNASYRYAGGDYTDNTRYDYARAWQDSFLRDLVRQAYEPTGLDLDAELEALGGTPRHAGHPVAADWIARHATVTGHLPAPLIAVKGLHDPASVPAEESGYTELVRRSGKTQLYRRLTTDAGGHTGQSALDLALAFDLLLERLDTGGWPAVDAPALTARAERMAAESDSAVLLGAGESAASAFSYVQARIPLHPRFIQEASV